MNKRIVTIASMLVAVMTASVPSYASNDDVISITIKDHTFIPNRVEVAAGKPFTLLIKNEDATPEEFESKALHREKIVAGGKSIKIKFEAVKPGEYEFVGEYHEDFMKGVIVAK